VGDGYTKLSLKDDVEDQAPKFDMSPSLEFRVPGEQLEAERSALSYLRVAPGFRLPFGHTHAQQEEVYVVVDGSAKLKLDDDVVELKPWDAVRIAPDTVRNVEAGPEGVELVLIGAPKTTPNDAEMIQNWWTDEPA
jgi:mannose-6-phosphate isomerase-like protein (cupin superfamily)